MPAALAPLADLGWLAILYVALGMAIIIAALVSIVFAVVIPAVSRVPFLGDALGGIAKDIEAKITGVLYSAIHELEVAIGAAWHWLAESVLWLWREFKSHAQLIAEVAGGVGVALDAAYHLRGLIHDLTRFAHGIDRLVRDFTKQFKGIDQQLKRLERDITRGIGHDLVTQVDALEKDFGRVVTDVIPAVEDVAIQALDDVGKLQKWIERNALIAGTGAFALAVTWALGSLGLGGLRCNSFRNLLGKYGCGLGSLLDALLGVVISALALESVCTTLPILESAFGEVVGPITHLLTEVPLGGCETPPTSWATLSVQMGPLPPPQTLGALPV